MELAEQAGGILREVEGRRAHGGGLGVVDKGGELAADGSGYVADVQTDADRDVEAAVLKVLCAAFPGLPVVAEEGCDVAGSLDEVPPLATDAAKQALAAPWPDELRDVDTERVVVFVDPLDGTGEFVKGNLYAVTNLFALCVDGAPVAGVINQPWAPGTEGRTVWGGPGVGVHGGLDPAAPLDPECVGTNRVVRDTRIEPALAAVGARGDAVHRVSASGYHMLRTLEGSERLLVLTRKGTKKWDSAAGEALHAAVGGVVTDCAGRRYRYVADPDTHQNLCGLLVSRDPDVHAAAVAAVSESTAPWPLDVDDPSVIDR